LDEETSKCAGLAQENGFAPTCLVSFAEAGKKAQAKLCTC
jgi:hypothetical protein